MSDFTDQFTATPTDPISALFKFLWVRFDSETTLSALIKVGNRITFSNAQRVIKENISIADVPEVILTFPTVTPVNVDSANDGLDVAIRWTVSSGTQQFFNKISQTSWLLTAMMRRIEQEGSPDLGLPNLVLNEIAFTEPISFGYLDPETNRGLIGYAAVLNLRASLIYNRGSAYNV